MICSYLTAIQTKIHPIQMKNKLLEHKMIHRNAFHSVTQPPNFIFHTHLSLQSDLTSSSVCLFHFDTNRQWQLLCAGVLYSQQSSKVKSYSLSSAVLAFHALCQIQTHIHQRTKDKVLWNHQTGDVWQNSYFIQSNQFTCNGHRHCLLYEICIGI